MSFDFEKIRPLADHVLIKRIAADDRSKGGIIIPDNAKEKPAEGTVVALGPGRIATETGRRIEPAIKKGDRVLFGKYSGSQLAGLQARDVEYVMCREEEILAVVEP